MAEAEAYDYEVDSGQQDEFAELGEASVAIATEGEPAEDPSMAATLFSIQDGKYMGTYTSLEGETHHIELLAHDSMLQEKVLSLEIGSEPIVNQGFGEIDGNPMIFQMTYERTEAGIVTTPAEFALNIDPETDELADDDDGGELITLDWAKKPPLAEAGRKAEAQQKKEGAKAPNRKTWLERELGIKSKDDEKTIEDKKPEGLLDYLERSANSEEASEPEKNTLTSAISKALEHEQPKPEVAVSQQPTKPQNSAESKPEQPSNLLQTKLHEPKPQETNKQSPETPEPSPDPQDSGGPDGGITIAPELEQPDKVTEEVISTESTSEAISEQSQSDIVEVQEASMVAIPDATNAGTHEIIILEQSATEDTQSDSEIVQAPRIAVETNAAIDEAPPAILEIAVPQAVVTEVESVIQMPDNAGEQIVTENEPEQVTENIELTQIELPASHNTIETPGIVAKLAEPRLVMEVSLPVEISVPEAAEVSLTSETSEASAAEVVEGSIVEDSIPVLVENVAVYLNEVQEQADTVETVAPGVVSVATRTTPITARPAAMNESSKIDLTSAFAEPTVFDEPIIKIAVSPIKVLTQAGVPHIAQITANQVDSTQEVTDEGIQITASLADAELPRRLATRRNIAHMTIQPVAIPQIQKERPTELNYVPEASTFMEEIVMQDPIQEVPVMPIELTDPEEQYTTPTIVKTSAPAVANTRQENISQIKAPEEIKITANFEDEAPLRPTDPDAAILTAQPVRATPPPSIPVAIASVEQTRPTTPEPTTVMEITAQNDPISASEPDIVSSPRTRIFETKPQLLSSASEHQFSKSPEIPLAPEEDIASEEAVQAWMNDFGSVKPQTSNHEAFTRSGSGVTIIAADTAGDDSEDDVITVNFDSDERRHDARRKGATRSTTA